MGIVREDISDTFNMDMKRVSIYVNKSNQFYKKIAIPKRKGGTREVYLPSSDIKMLQHYISEKYFSKIQLSSNATAYIKSKSIIDNARPHIKNKHFLFTDISNFFDNIKRNLFSEILLKELPFLSPYDVEDILSICTYKNRFVQGAVTSPIISNIYLKSFDEFLQGVVKNIPNGVYTRYSDDITISSSEFLNENITKIIADELSKLGLFVNNTKTYFSSFVDEIEITGLKISGNRISLSNKKKREIKNMIYHKFNKKSNSSETAEQIIGHMFYLRQIEPQYYNTLNLKYKKKKKLLIDRLFLLKNEENIQKCTATSNIQT
ncbi:Reverse transcriptase (RNA-dependent DNA polymerase) [Paracholeplasma brassicae]|uniref:RNA-directed DNA polymerase n=1 Tax=Acholeplasma brassicae TaxID=61635 RepID=U4KTH3_9MOLU|nr:retron St85 family RNA-directed DNA polymerase [Paracholeplasma brassicae]CCV66689.1 Reverse transcriptase (RNA-dependent DNA polymerase) [Paracholeplasma brassicae]